MSFICPVYLGLPRCTLAPVLASVRGLQGQKEPLSEGPQLIGQLIGREGRGVRGTAAWAGMAGAAPGDRGQLEGLRSSPDLNGRRGEVGGQAAGKDGSPRFAVRLLSVFSSLVEAMQALMPGADPEERRDWAGGLPDEVLVKIAETLVAKNEADWAAVLDPDDYLGEKYIQEKLAKRKLEGNCLFVFALVCKGWPEAQLKVGGRLRTRALSDVVLPGRVALVKWALAEGCPREHGDEDGCDMATIAAQYGRPELAQWLCQERGFPMDASLMNRAAGSGNLELVRWLRDEGCPWGSMACHWAVYFGRVEVLRWVRENGCPWTAETRDKAAETLGYTDDLGNLVDTLGN